MSKSLGRTKGKRLASPAEVVDREVILAAIAFNRLRRSWAQHGRLGNDVTLVLRSAGEEIRARMAAILAVLPEEQL